MKLTEQQDNWASKLAYWLMYLAGTLMILYSAAQSLSSIVGIIGALIFASAYYTTGKEKAIKQIKKKYSILGDDL